MVAVTAAASWRWYETPSWRRAAFAALGVVLVLLGVAMSLHSCDAGQPLMQWLLPMGCMLVVALAVGPPRIALTLALLAAAAAVAASFHYAALVHGPYWVGNAQCRSLSSPARSQWHTPISGLYRR